MGRAAARAACGAIAVLMMLAGCRTAPPAAIVGPGSDAPWPEQRAALETLDHFALNGRVAVAANGQGFSASLRYRQAQRRGELALDGPLGVGGLRVATDGDDLRVATSRGEQLDGLAARTELERRLGFAVPLGALRWWLLGIPAPGEATLEPDPHSGEIRRFSQAGWQVDITERAPALGFALPRRLTVSREGARLKLLVERWQ